MNIDNNLEEFRKKYEVTPLDKWDDFEIIWDTDPDHFRYTFDNFTDEIYKRHHPNGLLLGNVNFADLTSNIQQSCLHPLDTFWKHGSSHKQAKVLYNWINGIPLSPILVSIWKDEEKKELIVGGGFHRLAVCLVKNPRRIPILVQPHERSEVKRFLTTLEW